MGIFWALREIFWLAKYGCPECLSGVRFSSSLGGFWRSLDFGNGLTKRMRQEYHEGPKAGENFWPAMFGMHL
jgi:hypothetical protein